MKFRLILLFLLSTVFVFKTALAESILRIYNNTDTLIYAAVYDEKGGLYKREGFPVSIASFAVVSVPRPVRPLFHTQRLVVAFDETLLQELITEKQDQASFSTHKLNDIDAKKQTIDLSVLINKNKLEISRGGGLLKKALGIGGLVASYSGEKIKNFFSVSNQDSYAKTVAQVRLGNALSSKEMAYLKKREAYSKPYLATFLNVSPDEIQAVPRIGMIMSGGGIRAMVSAFGWLEGAEKIGLLDTITYLAALSGSTWAVGSWMMYKATPAFADTSLHDIKNHIFSKIIRGLTDIKTAELKDISRSLLVRLSHNQPTSIVDLFGYFLESRFFDDLGQAKHASYLYNQEPLVMTGTVPFPIYTAVIAENELLRFQDQRTLFEVESANKPWLEYSPVEVGTPFYGGVYVPAWAFGRSFDKGVSINSVPGVTIGKMMATCGSAFAAAQEVILQKISSPLIKDYLVKILDEKAGFSEKYGTRSVPYTRAREYNFMRGLSIPGLGDLEQKDSMRLKDAGLSFNLPFPPLSGERSLERKMDVLIVCDASAGLTEKSVKDFKHLALYAEAAGVPFPKIDFDQYPDLSERAVTVFEDVKNSEAPIVIYMPMCNDARVMSSKMDTEFEQAQAKTFDIVSCIKKVCSTFNFKWPRDVSSDLSRLMEHNMVAAADIIREAVKKVTPLLSKEQIVPLL